MSLPGLFVVGTDTGVGKTRVASAIARTWAARAVGSGVLKPVGLGGRARDGGLWSRPTPSA